LRNAFVIVHILTEFQAKRFSKIDDRLIPAVFTPVVTVADFSASLSVRNLLIGSLFMGLNVYHLDIHCNLFVVLYFFSIYNYCMDKKTTTVLMRLSAAEKAGFEQCAQLAGIALSAWIRERLRLAAIKELENAGQKIPFIKPVSLGE